MTTKVVRIKTPAPSLTLTADDPFLPAVLMYLRRIDPERKADLEQLHRRVALYQSEHSIRTRLMAPPHSERA